MKNIMQLLLMIIVLSCTGNSIKKMPAEGNWIKCPVCHGSGEIEEYERYGEKEPDEKDLPPAVGCMASVFRGNNEVREYEWEKQQKQNSGEYTGDKVAPAVVSKKIKCPNCGGTGWVLYEPVEAE